LKQQKRIKFPPPPEVPWDVFILALAQAHDRGMNESEKSARAKARRQAKKRQATHKAS